MLKKILFTLSTIALTTQLTAATALASGMPKTPTYNPYHTPVPTGLVQESADIFIFAAVVLYMAGFVVIAYGARLKTLINQD